MSEWFRSSIMHKIVSTIQNIFEPSIKFMNGLDFSIILMNNRNCILEGLFKTRACFKEVSSWINHKMDKYEVFCLSLSQISAVNVWSN